ncbi:hypothetical protein AtEden1_Chr1g0044041 [Arabidopsis thaliana]
MNVWMYAHMNVYMHAHMNVCMYACMNVWMYECMNLVLFDLTDSNGPRVAGISRLASISQVVPNGSWILPLVVLLRACLHIQPRDTNFPI